MDENTRLQSEEHPLVNTADFTSLTSYALYLKHLKAYDVVSEMADGLNVLDLGCNLGYGTNHISQRARSVTGVDVSAEAIAEATHRFAGDKVTFTWIDGYSLPFDDDSFDLICSCQVIEHISEMERYLGEIRRVLNPGGVVVFTTPNRSIRLDPGMAPWYSFHVEEFTGDGLHDVLSPWFDEVEVLGLFATDELYQSEIERCARARDGARAAIERSKKPTVRARRAVFGAVRTLVPDDIYAKIRQAYVDRKAPKTDPVPKVPLGQDVLDRFSTTDYHYRRTDIDSSIDLMAICHLSGDPSGQDALAPLD